MGNPLDAPEGSPDPGNSKPSVSPSATAIEPELRPEVDERRRRGERRAHRKKKKKKIDGRNAEDADAGGGRGAPIGSSRGVETMFRTSYMVNMQLSTLADAKANIMISINGFILSIILAIISPKIDSNPWLLIPSAVLLITCLVSIVYAVLAARPRVSRTYPQGARTAAAPGEVGNLLFFGYFAGIDLETYERAMTELIADVRRLYPVMIRDLHSLGSVLERKFSLLQRSYSVFMFGLIAGVTLFLIVLAWVAVAGTPLP